MTDLKACKIIAVDFDGTLCENKWPEIGAANEELIEYLCDRQKNGDKLILWTCRVDDMLRKAVEWCKEKGLVFDEVNENLPEIIESFGSDTRKIFANYDSCEHTYDHSWQLGKADHDLMMRLSAGGSTHAKYRRMIIVYADITAPLYWWKEFDTYKVGTVANSCSTMHKIAEKAFMVEDFSIEHLMSAADDNDCPLLQDPNDPYNAFSPQNIFMLTLRMLNACRAKYLETKDKDHWWQMIQILPSSYNQKRTVMLNYEVLAGIYPMRKNHKLDEWVEFCKWIETLPYPEIIVGEKVKFYADGKEINL